MSGFEVVGVILGVLPLAISGLEHYAEGVRTIKRTYHYSRDFSIVARKLNTQQDIFRNTVSKLLSESVDFKTQQRLMANIGGQEWESPQCKAALRKRLHDSYDSSLGCVCDISRTLQELVKKLKITPDGQVPFEKNSSASFRAAFKRFKFALDASEYARLIDDITSYNTNLRVLTEQTQSFQTEQRSKRMPDFENIRSNAISIYSSLKHALHVSCNVSHRASIYLRPTDLVSQQTHGSSIGNGKENVFRIVLHHGTPSGKQNSGQWSIKEAEVHILDADFTGANPDIGLADAMATVRFKDVAPIVVPSASTLTKQNIAEIRDLCESISKLPADNCGVCLGYMSGPPQSHRHGLYWPRKQLLEQGSFSAITLGDVLRKQNGRAAARLTNASVHEMAVVLASGMLRLHDTDWFPKEWGKEDITVINHKGKIMGQHAFISRDLGQSTLPPPVDPNPILKRAMIIRNDTLFALGILLIELCMSTSINELHEPEDLNPDGSTHGLSDYYTALRLLDSGEISDHFGTKWSDVVRRCILCNFGQSSTSLEDAKFRKAVYDDVIAELEEYHRQFSGHNIDCM